MCGRNTRSPTVAISMNYVDDTNLDAVPGLICPGLLGLTLTLTLPAFPLMSALPLVLAPLLRLLCPLAGYRGPQRAAPQRGRSWHGEGVGEGWSGGSRFWRGWRGCPRRRGPRGGRGLRGVPRWRGGTGAVEAAGRRLQSETKHPKRPKQRSAFRSAAFWGLLNEG
jgi:hypothetical protein